jgi:hypothetical protein
MALFDPKTTLQWMQAHARVSAVTRKLQEPQKAQRIASQLLEAAWPLQNAAQRSQHEQNAQSVRLLWVEYAKRAGKLPLQRATLKRR